MKDHGVRDMLPDLAAGRLDAMRARRVEAHVAGCEECAAELDVLRALAGAAPAVPEGLDARVRAVVERELGRRAAEQRVPATRRLRSWSPWLAAAAAGIVALVGGTLVMSGDADNEAALDAEVLALETGAPYGALPGADGELAGVATLDDLSEDELEELLAELEL